MRWMSHRTGRISAALAIAAMGALALNTAKVDDASPPTSG
jgi:hypothetical protein